MRIRVFTTLILSIMLDVANMQSDVGYLCCKGGYMPKTSQFQNLALQQALQDYSQQPTVVQPALTLPIKPEALVPLPPAKPLFSQALPIRSAQQTTTRQRHDETLPSAFDAHEETSIPDLPGALLPSLNPPAQSRKKKQLLRGMAILLSALLILAIYLAWHATTPTSASPTVTQQTSSALSSNSGSHPTGNPTSAGDSVGTTIQVYIVGAVKHPGVYILPADARVYQLIKVAGGTQSNADLVSLNLAAKLVDGEEVYVLSVGETPPASMTNSPGAGTSGTPDANTGSPVNINTATETEMEKALHISSTTAKKIVDYRTQHGQYASIDQLLQVVSQTIYDRIKNLVTV